MGRMSKYEIGKYKKGKDGTNKHWHLATFRKSCQYCNVDKCDIRFVITGL